MARLIIIIFMCTYWGSVPALALQQVGIRHVTLSEQPAARKLDVALLYPTSSPAPAALIGDNPAFYGVPLIENGEPLSGTHPLVVISHGYGGNWMNQLWLAHALARQGYIVAAPNHPGTTTTNMDDRIAAKLWLRPDDISRTISAVQHRADVGRVAARHIAVIGHSLGGWTALAIAGARFDAGQFAKDCLTHPQLASCRIYQQIGAGQDAPSRRRLDASLRDQRVTAVVSLDLGLARGFTKTSLAAVTTPVLVIAAGYPDEKLPAALESHYLARQLPPARSGYQEIADATHFTFMQLCKPGAAELINASSPGDGIICSDGGTRSRASLHHMLINSISAFLARTWRQE